MHVIFFFVGWENDPYSYQNISSSPSRYFNIIIALNLTFKSLYALVQHLIFRARVKNSHFPWSNHSCLLLSDRYGRNVGNINGKRMIALSDTDIRGVFSYICDRYCRHDADCRNKMNDGMEYRFPMIKECWGFQETLVTDKSWRY